MRMKRSKVKGRSKMKRRAIFMHAVPELCENVLMEILRKLPAKSLMRFKCVSKFWSSIIPSRYITNLFLESLLRQQCQFLYLAGKEGHTLLSPRPRDIADIEFYIINKKVTIPGVEGCFVNALRSLVCFRIGGDRVRICNLTTKQHVELPSVKSYILEDDDFNMWNHFGYDPIRDEYKVLSLVWGLTREGVLRSENQVLVLSPGASWRKITQCIVPHRPHSQQCVFINCVLYYGAWTSDDTCVVVSFDMRIEEFNLIELPHKAWDMHVTSLMNYKGQIAVFNYSSQGIIDLWVMEDAGLSQWSNKTFVFPNRVLYGDTFSLHGISHEGAIISANKTNLAIHHVCDLETGKTIGIFALTYPHLSFFDIQYLHVNYLDDFESIMYLEV